MPELLFRMKRNVGWHTMMVGGQKRTLKPGDEVRCEKDLLRFVMDKFDQVEPDPPPPEPKTGLKAVHRGFGKWDVINEQTGRPVNDKPLTKEDAKELARLSPPEAEQSFEGEGQDDTQSEEEVSPDQQGDKGTGD